jgi:hypothetical protein
MGSDQMAWVPMESVGKAWEEGELAQTVCVLMALVLLGSVKKVLVQMV